ncbi:MAG: pentapeptide repeat-containing protein [Bradymonadia bacterium]
MEKPDPRLAPASRVPWARSLMVRRALACCALLAVTLVTSPGDVHASEPGTTRESSSRKCTIRIARGIGDLPSQQLSIVLNTSEFCSACPPVESAFRRLVCGAGVEKSVFIADWSNGVPQLFAIRAGRVVDRQFGATGSATNEHSMLHFFVRNGIIGGSLDEIERTRTRVCRFKASDSFIVDQFCVYDGLSAERFRFTGAILAAVRFRGSNLRGADFTDAWLSHVDFTGTDLRGAVFDRAEGAAVVCPDGRKVSGRIDCNTSGPPVGAPESAPPGERPRPVAELPSAAVPATTNAVEPAEEQASTGCDVTPLPGRAGGSQLWLLVSILGLTGFVRARRNPNRHLSRPVGSARSSARRPARRPR